MGPTLTPVAAIAICTVILALNILELLLEYYTLEYLVGDRGKLERGNQISAGCWKLTQMRWALVRV
jgi:hypothetical protein